MVWEGCGRHLDGGDIPNSGPFPRSDKLSGDLVSRSWASTSLMPSFWRIERQRVRSRSLAALPREVRP